MIGVWLDRVAAQPALVLLVLSGASLAAALVSQYGFGLHPCILCLYQRVPYGVVMAAAGVALFFRQNRQVIRALLALSALAFVVGAGIALYHVGVEQHWWQGAGGCSGAGDAADIEALRAQILGSDIVRCDEPELVVLGISMAGYNVLYSLALVGVCWWLWRRV